MLCSLGENPHEMHFLSFQVCFSGVRMCRVLQGNVTVMLFANLVPRGRDPFG